MAAAGLRPELNRVTRALARECAPVALPEAVCVLPRQTHRARPGLPEEIYPEARINTSGDLERLCEQRYGADAIACSAPPCARVRVHIRTRRLHQPSENVPTAEPLRGALLIALKSNPGLVEHLGRAAPLQRVLARCKGVCACLSRRRTRCRSHAGREASGTGRAARCGLVCVRFCLDRTS